MIVSPKASLPIGRAEQGKLYEYNPNKNRFSSDVLLLGDYKLIKN
jgi:hypothetical protein